MFGTNLQRFQCSKWPGSISLLSIEDLLRLANVVSRSPLEGWQRRSPCSPYCLLACWPSPP